MSIIRSETPLESLDSDENELFQLNKQIKDLTNKLIFIRIGEWSPFPDNY